jgi:hypothetical protein
LRVAMILLRHSAERAPLRYFAKFGGALRGKRLRHVKIVEALKRLLGLLAAASETLSELKRSNHGLPAFTNVTAGRLRMARIGERRLPAWLFRLPGKTNFPRENVRGHRGTTAEREPPLLKKIQSKQPPRWGGVTAVAKCGS